MAISGIYWVNTLPQQPLIDGYTEEAAGKKIRTTMDAAVAKQRNRYSTTTIPFTCVFLFTMDEYIVFKNFFNVTLVNGSLEFNMQVVGDPTTTQVVRFTERNYSPEFLGLHVRVTCNLEVMP